MITVFIVVVAFAWFMTSFIVQTVQLAGRQIAINLGTVDQMYINVDQFISIFFMGVLVVGGIGLVLWAWQYTQRQTYYGG